MLTSRLQAANAEIEDLQCQIVSYSKHLEVGSAVTVQRLHSTCPLPDRFWYISVKFECSSWISLAGVATSIIFGHMFVPTSLLQVYYVRLSWQKYALLRQNHVCCSKHLLWQMFSHDENVLLQQTQLFQLKTFVTTSVLLLRQKTCFVAANTLVSPKAPTSDSWSGR